MSLTISPPPHTPKKTLVSTGVVFCNTTPRGEIGLSNIIAKMDKLPGLWSLFNTDTKEAEKCLYYGLGMRILASLGPSEPSVL